MFNIHSFLIETNETWATYEVCYVSK